MSGSGGNGAAGDAGRLAGSGIGDLVVDRARVCATAVAALRRPGVHLLIAEHGTGAPAVVDHCRAAIPELRIGRCHSGDLSPPMAPLLEAWDLVWPRLAPVSGVRATEGADAAWNETPDALLGRLPAGDPAPVVLLDAHEAQRPVVKALVEMAARVAAGASYRVLVVAQPWRRRSTQRQWLDELESVATSRLELSAASAEGAWRWFSAAVGPEARSDAVPTPEALFALTAGNPLLVGLVADAVRSGRVAGSPLDVMSAVRGLGPQARAVAAAQAVAELSPLPEGCVDVVGLRTVTGLPAAQVRTALAELEVCGVVVRVPPRARRHEVRLSDAVWADAVNATFTEDERVQVQVRLLERAVAMNASPAMVAVHLAAVDWADDAVTTRLERAVLGAASASPVRQMKWLDVLDQTRPLEPRARVRRQSARLEAFARLEHPAFGAAAALQVARTLDGVDDVAARRVRRAMAFGALVEGRHDDAIVELLDLREEWRRDDAWFVLTADLALMYLLAGRFALAARSSVDVWTTPHAPLAARVAAGSVLALVRSVTGDVRQGLQVCDAVVGLSAGADQPVASPLPYHLFVAMVRYEADQIREAAGMVALGLRSSVAVDGGWAAAAKHGLLARLALRSGRLDEAAAAGRRGAECAERGDGIGAAGWWAGVPAWVAWLRSEDPEPWLARSARGAMTTAQLGAEMPLLLRAVMAEAAGDVVGAAQSLHRAVEVGLAMRTVTGLSPVLPTAARLAVLADDAVLREMVLQTFDSGDVSAVPSKAAERLAAQAWLGENLGMLSTALRQARGDGSVLLAAELASDGELLARRTGDQQSAERFAELARARWTALGVPQVAEQRAAHRPR